MKLRNQTLDLNRYVIAFKTDNPQEVTHLIAESSMVFDCDLKGTSGALIVKPDYISEYILSRGKSDQKKYEINI